MNQQQTQPAIKKAINPCCPNSCKLLFSVKNTTLHQKLGF